MVHSEEEVVEALALQFEENMRIDETDLAPEQMIPEQVEKPVFVKK